MNFSRRAIRVAIANSLRRILKAVDALDPSVRLRADGPPPPGQLLCVYRAANWEHVAALVRQCDRLGWPSHLHALDEPHPALEHRTDSVGPGGRFHNLNQLAARADRGRWTVISDDDVVLPYGGIGDLVWLSNALSLDIAQPAHRADSYYNHRFTRRRPGLLARVTRFVEIGPLVVFSPSAWPHVSPFPEEGMGWGTELAWHDLRDVGLLLGIVDCVPLLHVGKPARSYDPVAEQQAMSDLLAGRELADLRPLQRTDRSYGFWRRGRLSGALEATR